jgi:hypothetical protein
MSNYAYEYIFNGDFDQTVFDQGPVQDSELSILVSNCANMIASILKYNDGINCFSSFVSYNNVNYRVTVNKLN